MSAKRFAVSIFSVAMMVLGAGLASGQTYPNKTIRLVTVIGGSNDFAARLLAQGLPGSLSQPVIVDNRGNGVIPGEVVSKAPPDGYTLLVAGVTFTIGHLLQEMPYDPVRDFDPISLIGISPLVLVVHPSLPVKSVKDLIALAKAKPGELNYASGAVGGASHLATELFKSMGGNLKIQMVPYKAAAQGIGALIGGETDMMIVTTSTGAAHFNSGKLRVLSVTSAQPTVLVPGVPTMAASGLPGYESAQMTLIVAPAKTPAAIITRLNQEVVRFLNQPEVKQKFLGVGVEVVTSSPEQLTVALKAEIARMSKVIKDANIKVN